MSWMSPYLALVSSDDRCIEVFNNCRTLQNMADPNRADAAWNTRKGSSGCACCWVHDDIEESDGDPWVDPDNPATLEAAGLLIDAPGDGIGFWIESPQSTDFRAARGSRNLQMFITFSVVSRTRRGELAILKWLTDVLADCCNECEGWSANVFEFCPCDQDFIGVPLETTVIPPSGAPAKSADPCDDDPDVLLPVDQFVNPDGTVGLPIPVFLDDGSRQLLQVRFVGIDQLFDQSLFECAGNRFIAQFEIVDPTWHSEPVTTCVLGGAGTWEDEECGCRPCDIIRCSDLPLVAEERCAGTSISSTTRRSNRRRAGRFKQPMCFQRQTCLTPPQPTSIDQRMRITVQNGGGTVHNAQLTVWAATEGIADPQTVQGSRWYDRRTPVAQYQIPEMGPNESIVINPDGEVLVNCASGAQRAGAGLVEIPAGSDLPTLSCDSRYWLTLDLSCDERSRGEADLSAQIDLVVIGEPS